MYINSWIYLSYISLSNIESWKDRRNLFSLSQRNKKRWFLRHYSRD